MKSSAFARQLILGVVTSITITFSASPAHSQATNQYDKGTPPQFAAGVSSFGSYTSADLGTVNLSNGALNLKIPLVNVGGRGLSLPITLNWSSKIWSASIDYDAERGDDPNASMVPLAYADYANADNYVGFEWRAEAGWTVGGLPFMTQRVVRINYTDIQPRGPCYDFTLPKLTFTMPDRGEIEFRDDVYDGAPLPSDCGGYTSGYSRGRRWHATDGSGAIYISDVDNGASGRFPDLTGVVITRDGTRFYLNAGGGCYLIVDRNGNKISFTENGIVDPLGRTTRIQSNVPDPDNPSETLAVLVTVTGYGGQPRYYKIKSGIMNEHYRSDINPSLPVITGSYDPMSWGYNDWWAPTATRLFPLSYGLFVQRIDDRPVIYEVILPDQRSLRFNYNEYGEVAEVQLPTGGKVWYDYSSDRSLPTGNSPVWETAGDYHTSVWQVDRAVIRRRTFPDGNNLEGTWNYFYSDSSAIVTASAPDGTLLLNQTHLFLPSGRYTESPYGGAAHTGTHYTLWSTGVEWRTETRDANGFVLAATEQDWTQRTPVTWPVYQQEQPANDNRVNQARRYLDDGNFARTDTFYDNMNYPRGNNVAEVWEYDFDQLLKRRTTTTYVTGSYQTDDSIHLVSLPLQQSIYDGAGVEQARTVYEYDVYSADGNHDALLSYASITGHDTANYGASRTTRGNVTRIANWIKTTDSYLYTYPRYDIVGNVVATKDARRNLSRVEYNDSFSDGNNSRNTFAYPTRTISPSASGYSTPLATSSTYDFSTGLMTATTDANGKTTGFEYYDPLNRLTRIDRPTGFTYTQTTSGGGWTIYSYGDEPGNLYVRTQTAQDASRMLDSYQFFDGLGRVTRVFQYEGVGEVTPPLPDGTSQASGTWSVVDRQYDAMGRVWRVSNPYRTTGLGGEVNPSSNWTTTSYDALGRVVSVTTPDSAVVRTAYSSARILVTDQAGKQRLSQTNALGQLTDVWEIKAADAATEPVSFPGHPEVTAGYRTAYKYDALDNLREVAQGQQRRYFMYDSLSRLILAKNPEQAVNSNLQGTDPVTGNTQWSNVYGYDANGNLTVRVDARGVSTDYYYDTLNRVTHIRYSDGSMPGVNFLYDGANFSGKGRLWKVETQGATATSVTIDEYDTLGRPLKQSQRFYANGAWSQAYVVRRQYNFAGQVTSQTYPSGHTASHAYNAAGRLESLSGNLGDGQMLTYSSGITYDAAGRMMQEQFGPHPSTNQINANLLYHKRRYNTRGQLVDVRLSTKSMQQAEWDADRGALIFHYGVTNNNGNLLQSEHWVPVSGSSTDWKVWRDTYSYDSLNRIASVAEQAGHISDPTSSLPPITTPLDGIIGIQTPGSSTWTPAFAQHYLYDRYGNRTIDQTKTTGSGINKTAFTVEAATNRLLVPSGASGTMSYDAAGNLTSDSYTSYGSRTYDAENRMTSAQVGGESWANYTYDGNGRRVRRRVSGQEVWQIYGMDGELLAEYTANAAPAFPQKEYGYRNGELLNTAASTGAHYLVADHLGTPRMVLDKWLSWPTRHDYLPFGEELFAGTGGRTTAQGYTAGDNVRQKFTSKERDNETGLDYFLARYYASAQGRFTSPDEFKGGPEELFDFAEDAAENPTFYAELDIPQSLNKYQYTYNNPLRYTDPTGHCVGVATPLRPLCLKLAQKAIERATPYVAGAVTALGAAVMELNKNNTVADPSCPSCGRSYEMGQSLMKRSERSRQQSQQQNQNQSNTASPNPGNNNDRNDRSQTDRTIRSLERQVTKHEQKLADYKGNPDRYDNKGVLKNASPETRQKIIEGRIRKLEREIRTFQREIQKMRENQ